MCSDRSGPYVVPQDRTLGHKLSLSFFSFMLFYFTHEDGHATLYMWESEDNLWG